MGEQQVVRVGVHGEQDWCLIIRLILLAVAESRNALGDAFGFKLSIDLGDYRVMPVDARSLADNAMIAALKGFVSYIFLEIPRNVVHWLLKRTL